MEKPRKWTLSQIIVTGEILIQNNKNQLNCLDLHFKHRSTLRIYAVKNQSKPTQTFTLFVPSDLIWTVFYVKGVRSTVKETISQYFNTNKIKFTSDPTANNFHFHGAFSFKFDEILNILIPQFNEKLNLTVKTKFCQQEDGLAAVWCETNSLKNLLNTVSQLYLFLTDKENHTATITLKFIRSKKATLTHCTVICRGIYEKLIKVLEAIENIT